MPAGYPTSPVPYLCFLSGCPDLSERAQVTGASNQQCRGGDLGGEYHNNRFNALEEPAGVEPALPSRVSLVLFRRRFRHHSRVTVPRTTVLAMDHRTALPPGFEPGTLELTALCSAVELWEIGLQCGEESNLSRGATPEPLLLGSRTHTMTLYLVPVTGFEPALPTRPLGAVLLYR